MITLFHSFSALPAKYARIAQVIGIKAVADRLRLSTKLEPSCGYSCLQSSSLIMALPVS